MEQIHTDWSGFEQTEMKQDGLGFGRTELCCFEHNEMKPKEREKPSWLNRPLLNNEVCNLSTAENRQRGVKLNTNSGALSLSAPPPCSRFLSESEQTTAL